MRQLALLLLPLLAACGSTTVTLPYTPTTTVQPAARPTIASVTVTDGRSETNPTWLGAVRGGYGNVMKSVTTARPVKDEVAAAFTSALAARGLLASGGAAPYRLDVTVNGLSLNQWMGSDGQAAFTVALVDARTSRTLYQDKSQAKVTAGSAFTLDNDRLANDLRDLGVRAMSQAIDEALDRPGFTTAVQTARVAGL